jgi:hypothetical protein
MRSPITAASLTCLFALSLVTPAPVHCDQARLVTCEQAESARQRLGSTVRRYCQPCGDVAFEEVASGPAQVLRAGDRCELEIAGKAVGCQCRASDAGPVA